MYNIQHKISLMRKNYFASWGWVSIDINLRLFQLLTYIVLGSRNLGYSPELLV